MNFPISNNDFYQEEEEEILTRKWSNEWQSMIQESGKEILEQVLAKTFNNENQPFTHEVFSNKICIFMPFKLIVGKYHNTKQELVNFIGEFIHGASNVMPQHLYKIYLAIFQQFASDTTCLNYFIKMNNAMFVPYIEQCNSSENFKKHVIKTYDILNLNQFQRETLDIYFSLNPQVKSVILLNDKCLSSMIYHVMLLTLQSSMAFNTMENFGGDKGLSEEESPAAKRRKRKFMAAELKFIESDENQELDEELLKLRETIQEFEN